jgi:hypothetical protein
MKTQEDKIKEEQSICKMCKEKCKMVNWILTGMCDKCNFAFQQGISSERERCLKEMIINNICEQEFLNYIFGYFNSKEPTDSHIRLLVKERLENTKKEYEILKSKINSEEKTNGR